MGPPRRSLQRRALPLGFSRNLLAIALREKTLPQSNRPRRHLDQLVVLDILKRSFQRQLPGWLQTNVLVRPRRPHVRELLFLGGIHVHVARTRILTDDHPFVHRLARRHEQRAPLLQRRQSERDDRAILHRDERPARARRQRPRPRAVLQETVVNDAGAARVREELRPVAEQPARRDPIEHANESLPRILISIISPRRGPSFSMTAPRYSSGTSIASS